MDEIALTLIFSIIFYKINSYIDYNQTQRKNVKVVTNLRHFIS